MSGKVSTVHTQYGDIYIDWSEVNCAERQMIDYLYSALRNVYALEEEGRRTERLLREIEKPQVEKTLLAAWLLFMYMTLYALAFLLMGAFVVGKSPIYLGLFVLLGAVFTWLNTHVIKRIVKFYE